MTIKPFPVIVFDHSGKACFVVRIFDLLRSERAFLFLYVQHNVDYVERRCFS